MSTNKPMTDERLAEARAALDEDMYQWGGEYGADLLAEVERLRALSTVDEGMVERGVEAHHETFNAWPVKRNLEDAENRRVAAMRAALNAALNPPRRDRMTREPMPQEQQDAGQECPAITDDMIERAARGIAAHWHDMHTNESLGRQRALAIAALDAALGTGEGA